MNRQDYVNLLEKINQPLRNHYKKGYSRIFFGDTGVGYGKDIAGIEGFARMLWGIGPAIHDISDSWLQEIRKGILEGTDPNSEYYWGKLHDRDQRMVEMPAIALSLIHGDKKLWRTYSQSQQQQIADWFYEIFYYECADGNWQFFKVIVSLVLKKLGFKVKDDYEVEALEKINHCYLGHGWYQDSSRGRQDYYTPFAFHYYGLLYSKLCPEKEQSKVFKKRAKEFAKEFIYFFAEDGSNIPFGRSMIYRYAAVAFWSMVIYTDLLPEQLGVIKGIIERNIEWWLSHNIFDESGLLTLGYTYSQLSMTEPYNSPVSPYWSNKIFILLELSESHPYWQIKAEKYPDLPKSKLLQEGNFIEYIDNGHNVLLNAGQPGPNYHALTNEKYFKFAYSSAFGFSVPRGSQLKEEQVIDSMIGIQTTDTTITGNRGGKNISQVGQFYTRNNVSDVVLTDQYVASTWKINDDIEIRTWLIPICGMQVRLHKLTTNKEILAYETSFSIENNPDSPGSFKELNKEGTFVGEKGFSAIKDLSFESFETKVSNINGFPNTNLMTPEVVALPGIERKVPVGTHLLITSAYGHPNREYGQASWQKSIEITADNDLVIIHCEDKNVKIKIK